MTTTTRFRRYDPSTLRDYSSVLFVGGKRTGKSTVMREFLYYIKDRVYDGHVWSGTVDEDHPWQWYFPKHAVHYCMEEFDSATLSTVKQTQEKRKALATKYGATCPPSVLVFEDLEFLKPSIWIDQGTRALVFNSRWLKAFFFIAYQYIMEVKMEMRGSFDVVVFAMDASRAVRERIWTQFAGVFPTLELFEAAFVELTKDYRVMVIDMRVRSYKIEDSVFWYRADPNLKRFRVGHPDTWVPRPMSSASAPAAIEPASKRFILVDDTKPPKKKKKI